MKRLIKVEKRRTALAVQKFPINKAPDPTPARRGSVRRCDPCSPAVCTTFRRSRRRNSSAPIVKKTPKKKSSLRYSSNICTSFCLDFMIWVGPDRSLGHSLKFTATEQVPRNSPPRNKGGLSGSRGRIPRVGPKLSRPRGPSQQLRRSSFRY